MWKTVELVAKWLTPASAVAKVYAYISPYQGLVCVKLRSCKRIVEASRPCLWSCVTVQPTHHPENSKTPLMRAVMYASGEC